MRQAIAAPLLIAVAVQNIGNLALHAILGRSLGPASYGELGTLLALLTLVTVPLAAVQAASSAAAAINGRAPGDGRRLMRIALGSSAVALVSLAAAPLAMSAFNLTSPIDAALLAPFLGISILLAVVRGRLLGHRRVGLTAVTFLVSIGLRIGLTIALVGPLGITGALLATLAGEVIATAVGVVALMRAPQTAQAAAPWLGGSDLARTAIALTGLFLFTTVDLFLARALLDPESAGAYVAAATIGKTLLALPAAALAAAYPRMVKAGIGPKRRPELTRTAIVVVGTALLAGIIVAAMPQVVLAVLFGSAYSDAASLVAVLALVAAASSIISLSVYAQLAVHSAFAFIPWVGAAIQVAVIAQSHGSALEIARGSAISLGITGVLALAPLAWSLRPRAAVALAA